MAKLGNITLTVGEFFTESRLRLCKNLDCKFNCYKSEDANCILKHIEIGSDGKCLKYEPNIEEK